MINVLVTGAHGQLGRCLYDEYNMSKPNDIYYFFKSHDELDITSQESIDKIFDSAMHYDYVINCAAYTNVAKAETDKEHAELINSKGVKLLAEACAKYDTKLIHISTDYVFDGTSDVKTEYAVPNPLQEYGLSKMHGEDEILKVPNLNYMIIRTSWLYSKYGNNFVKTIYHKILKGEKFTVVTDQIGSPTSANNLAKCILSIIEKCENQSQSYKFLKGFYHFSDDGTISWYDFAKAIEEFIYKASDIVQPCLTSDFPTNVIRPNASIWSKNELKNLYNIKFEYWKNALYRVLIKLS